MAGLDQAEKRLWLRSRRKQKPSLRIRLRWLLSQIRKPTPPVPPPASLADGKELEASLATPEVLDALAEKVSGEKVPRIGAVKGGNLNTSQQVAGVGLSESELALKVLDLMDWYGKNHAW